MNDGLDSHSPEPAHPGAPRVFAARALVVDDALGERRRPPLPAWDRLLRAGVTAPPHAEPAAEGVVEDRPAVARDQAHLAVRVLGARPLRRRQRAAVELGGAAHAVQGAEGARQLAVVRLARPPLGPPVGVEPQPHAQRRLLKRPARHLREGVAALRPPPARPGARDRRHGVVQLDAAGAHAHARRRREQLAAADVGRVLRRAQPAVDDRERRPVVGARRAVVLEPQQRRGEHGEAHAAVAYVYLARRVGERIVCRRVVEGAILRREIWWWRRRRRCNFAARVQRRRRWWQR